MGRDGGAVTSAAAGSAERAEAAAAAMAQAAQAFLASLDDERRAAAAFPFEGGERYLWHYTPVARNGLRLKDMTPAQRGLALRLLDTALSARGARQARGIIALETILDEWEGMQGSRMSWERDPELYYFSVFGAPGGARPWGWRAGGHHLGIHATIAANAYVSVLPLFLGANPAQVRHGPHTGTRTLPDEEDLARALLANLSGAQKRRAIVDPTAPDDILTKNYRVADPAAIPRGGVVFADLRDGQRQGLVGLIRHYVQRANGELAALEWRRIEADGLDAVRFLWAGPEARGQGHYYAVAGPSFVIEYDNTQNGANHIHSVLRSYRGDWGEDLLAAHYADGGHAASSSSRVRALS